MFRKRRPCLSCKASTLFFLSRKAAAAFYAGVLKKVTYVYFICCRLYLQFEVAQVRLLKWLLDATSSLKLCGFSCGTFTCTFILEGNVLDYLLQYSDCPKTASHAGVRHMTALGRSGRFDAGSNLPGLMSGGWAAAVTVSKCDVAFSEDVRSVLGHGTDSGKPLMGSFTPSSIIASLLLASIRSIALETLAGMVCRSRGLPPCCKSYEIHGMTLAMANIRVASIAMIRDTPILQAIGQ